MTPALDYLSQGNVQTLNRIRRLNQLPHLRRERQKGNDLYPQSPLRLNSVQISYAKRALFERAKGSLYRLGTDGLIDRFELCGQCLSVLPGHVIQAVTNQVYDAGLDHGLRKHRL
jgi:hypothetical protein